MNVNMEQGTETDEPITLETLPDLKAKIEAIKDAPISYEHVKLWFRLQSAMRDLKDIELELRKRIFEARFPSPKEGTNTSPINDGSGFVLKGQHKISRDVDSASFLMIRAMLTANNIKADELVEWKPELKISAYRQLTAEQAHLFDQCLIIKPGCPSLEIVKPKRSKG